MRSVMKIPKTLLALIASFGAATLTACEDGAEGVGAKIDDAAEVADEALKDAADAIEDAVEDL